MVDFSIILIIFGLTIINFILCEVLNHLDKSYYTRYMNLSTALIIIGLVLGKVYNLMNTAIRTFGSW